MKRLRGGVRTSPQLDLTLTRPALHDQHRRTPTPPGNPPNDDATGWRRWGPYVTERAWGTVREDYSADGDAWDYLPHDHGAQQGLSLGRGRHRRASATATSSSCFAPGLLERPRPDPQGAALRPDAARGQPRRGRQGVLLLPRRHADARLHEVPLQVPAGASIPYARLVEENRAARRPRAGVRAARHRHLRRRPLLRHRRRVRQGRRPRTSASASRRSTAGPDDAPLHVLPHLWFRNTWAWGARRAAASRRSRAGREATGFVSARRRRLGTPSRCRTCRSTTGSARATCTRRPAATPLFTDNETNAPRVFGPGTPSRQPVRQGRVPPPRRRRRDRARIPTASAPRPACTTGAMRARRAARSVVRLRLTTGRG